MSAKTGKILTGNVLLSGDVVFYTGAGQWSVDATDASLAVTEADIAILEKAEIDGNASNTVVSTEIIAAEATPAGIWPTRNREIIRAKGPTTHPHMGNQARRDFTAFKGA